MGKTTVLIHISNPVQSSNRSGPQCCTEVQNIWFLFDLYLVEVYFSGKCYDMVKMCLNKTNNCKKKNVFSQLYMTHQRRNYVLLLTMSIIAPWFYKSKQKHYLLTYRSSTRMRSQTKELSDAPSFPQATDFDAIVYFIAGILRWMPEAYTWSWLPARFQVRDPSHSACWENNVRTRFS